KGGPKTQTGVGCLAGVQNTNQVTFADAQHNVTYRVTGTDLREYVGQRVQVVVTSPKRLHVTGGLLPTPTVAAQAGAIDPAQAATAAVAAGRGNQAANTTLTELRVRSAKPVAGGCPQ